MRPLVLIVTVAALIVGGAACGGDDPAELVGIQRLPLPTVDDVDLPDASSSGEAFALRADDGELLIVYFGYTSCPDVCPTTMSDVRYAIDELGDDADGLEVAMITVDPQRDTDEVLTGYVQSFVTDAHALRTEDDETLRAAADAFGASYDVSADADGDVEVAHTGFLYAVDDEGQLLVTWPFGTDADDLESDLRLLMDATA